MGNPDPGLFDSLIGGGFLSKAAALCGDWVKNSPSDVTARKLLFYSLCYSQAWERATVHLKAWAKLEPASWPFLMSYERMIQFESQRAEVFSGAAEPRAHSALDEDESRSLKVLNLLAKSQLDQARQTLTAGASPAAAASYSVNGQTFASVEDMDQRFGRLVEVFSTTGHGFVGLSQIKVIKLQAVESHLDFIWRPISIDLLSGNLSGYWIVRYPMAAECSQESLVLGHKTSAEELFEGFCIGRGRRVLMTEGPQADFDVMEISEIGRQAQPVP